MNILQGSFSDFILFYEMIINTVADVWVRIPVDTVKDNYIYIMSSMFIG